MIQPLIIMKYRDHKGDLQESMNTVIEVNSVDEIISHLNTFYNQLGKEVEDIKFQYVGYDSRIEWDTYYVLQRFKGSGDFKVAGMSNGCF